jgi:diguanylate cyclase (GGDEF)-like protein/PAS domain S-box-containing protein
MGALGPDADEAVVQLALRDPYLHKALLDQLEEGVCIVDRDHRILFWNSGAGRISGYLAHEVAGQFSHGDLLMHYDDDAGLASGQESPLTAVMQDGKPHDSMVFLRHREGHRILVSVQSRPVRDANGASIGAIEVFDEVVAPRRHVHELEEFGCADPSTRAANRRYGEMTLRHALEALDVFGVPFGWLRVGLDGAKDLDRGFGHGMVDAAVKMIAATLDRNLGSLDVLTRWEPAEFRLEVNGCSRSQLAGVAERLRLLVRASSLDWWGDRLRVTVSVGGATAEAGDTIESLETRVAEVYYGCQASGGDRAAVAHLSGSGAPRCSR